MTRLAQQQKASCLALLLACLGPRFGWMDLLAEGHSRTRSGGLARRLWLYLLDLYWNSGAWM